VDAVLIVDAYHEMTEYEAILAAVYGALKPGGRLVILDLVPPDSSAARDRQTANHRLGMSVVDREIRAAGFEVIERDPRFTTSGRGSGQWMLVARRPALPRWDSNPGSLLASPRTTQTRATSSPAAPASGWSAYTDMTLLYSAPTWPRRHAGETRKSAACLACTASASASVEPHAS
jgi:SAM-dependent methyltransferase